MQRDSYYEFKLKLFDWLDNILKNTVPETVIALCFNLYECEDFNWKLELVGTDKYIADNDDWACDEVCDFLTRKNPFVWQEPPRSKWEFVKNKVFLAVYDYLQNGKYGYVLESKKCVAIGFVDGDLSILHTAKQQKKYVSRYFIWSVVAIVTAIALCLFEIFILSNATEHSLFWLVALSASVIAFFVRLAVTENKELAAVEKDYSKEIASAFKYDKKNRIKLLRAIKFYNNSRYLRCLKLLNKIYDNADDLPDRQAIELFTALTCQEIDDTENAIQAYNGVLRENPLNVTALNNLAAIYSSNNDFDKAIYYATSAINAGEDPFSYATLSTAYLKKFDIEEAIDNAKRALELKPDLAAASNTLAVAYSLENSALSEEYIKKSVALGVDREKILSAVEGYKESFEEHKKQLARIADLLNKWREHTKRQTIAVMLQENKTKSIIGGKINETPPISQNGEEMKLLAAVFCSELPENTVMPQKGVLRFYIVPDEYYGADFENFELNKQKNFKVLFDEDEEKFVTSAQNEPDENFPVLRSRYLSFSEGFEGMTLTDYRFEKTFKHFLKDNECEVREEDLDLFEEKINAFNHKILGYPSFTQEDPRFEGGCFEKYDTLLFQLVSESVDGDDEIMMGDSGVMQFFIPSEKLAKRDFTDILYTWDCY